MEFRACRANRMAKRNPPVPTRSRGQSSSAEDDESTLSRATLPRGRGESEGADNAGVVDNRSCLRCGCGVRLGAVEDDRDLISASLPPLLWRLPVCR